MYQDLKQLYGRKLRASDGEIGHVQDFYFDDLTWAVRYVVVDTGTWLTGHQVLLSPHAFGAQGFGRSDSDYGSLRVHLTRQQIADCPSIETHRPVSRQYEEDSTVFVNLTQDDIRQTTKNDVAQPAVAAVGPGDPAD